jgi:hypothetical protein
MRRLPLTTILLIINIFASAQTDTLAAKDTVSEKPAVRKARNQWGVRTNFRLGVPYSGVIIPDATYAIGWRHQFAAGPMLSFAGDYKLSPLLGGHVSYQYAPFRKHHFTKAYAYYSGDAGGAHAVWDTHFLTEYVDGVPTYVAGESDIRDFFVTNTLGAGVEFLFGRHFYANLATGVSVVYAKRHSEKRYTEPTSHPQPEPYTFSETRGGIELNWGFGWRF